ncbi:hypothetical protein ACN9MD_09660 [Stenotrophomonas maltophilia]|uniref:hypothetical protein n=1 Tax=Stenotrophomonas maltophilia TaxID=40324 RepID=UPI003CF9616E
MNLEQIDTSTTAGKAEVMRLAAEGRTVAMLPREKAAAEALGWTSLNGDSDEWNWPHFDYAIISEPVGPEEKWCVIGADGQTMVTGETRSGVENFARREGMTIVRYIRADLAGEKG